jgi:hypothetical protein
MKNEKNEMKFSREIVEKYVNRVGRAGFYAVYPGERWNVKDLKDVISGKIKERDWFMRGNLHKTNNDVRFFEALHLLVAVRYLRKEVTKKSSEILVFLRSEKKEILKEGAGWTWDGSPHITGYKERGAE